MHDYFCDDAIRPNKAVSYALIKKMSLHKQALTR